jgi:hypothetical protein
MDFVFLVAIVLMLVAIVGLIAGCDTLGERK